MQTTIIAGYLSNGQLNNSGIKQAASAIREGEILAFPTETVYGLGADATNSSAVEKIFFAKGRPSDNPLIVHIADTDQIKKVVREWPEEAQILAETFWPGPLTIILPKARGISDSASAGLDTIGIRMPAHPVAQALIRSSQVPLAAPSANLSTFPSTTQASHVLQDLNGRIRFIVDGGECQIGIESTVLDLTSTLPKVLRPGQITLAQLRNLLPQTVQENNLTEKKPRSPGLKYAHYAPRAKLILFEHPDQIRERITQNSLVLCVPDDKDVLETVFTPNLRIHSLTTQNLFDLFREADTQLLSEIFIFNTKHLRDQTALFDRVSKATNSHYTSP